MVNQLFSLLITIEKTLVTIIYKLLLVLIFHKLKEFVFESYYKQIGFSEKDGYYSLGKVKNIYYYLLLS